MGSPEFTGRTEDVYTDAIRGANTDYDTVSFTAAAGTSTGSSFAPVGSDSVLISLGLGITNPPASANYQESLVSVQVKKSSGATVGYFVGTLQQAADIRPFSPGVPVPANGQVDITIYNYEADPIDIFAAATYLLQ